MPGRRHGTGAEHGLAGALELTEEQLEQARDIRAQTHEDVKALREAAREEINALLTEEQLAQLEERRADRPQSDERSQDGRHRGGRPRGVRGQGLQRSGEPLGDRHQPFDTLDLSEEQQSAIDVIRENVHEDIRTLKDAGREAFRAILTPEQIEILDQLHPPADDQVELPDPVVEG